MIDVLGLQSDGTGLGVNKKSVIIMDEVDGMSAGDRGGVGALNAFIRKTKVPIIAICNDKTSQKMKPLMNTTFQMSFKRYDRQTLSIFGSQTDRADEIGDIDNRPQANEIRSRIMSIAFK